MSNHICNRHKIRNTVLICIIVVITTFCVARQADWKYDRSGLACALSSMAAGKHNLDMPGRIFGLVQWVNTVDEPDLLENPMNQHFKYAIDIYDTPEIYGGQYLEYKSQLGLHGWVYYFIGKYIPSPQFFAQASLIFLFSAVLIFICIEIYKKYGPVMAITFFLVTITSQYIVNAATSLFYVTFTWILPMLLGLICLNNFDKRRMLYPFFFLAILIKSLCLYEYLPVVMLGSIMFLVAEMLINIRKDKKYSRQLLVAIIIIGILELLAVAVTFTIHACLRGEGNILAGMETIYNNDILRRTYNTDISHLIDEDPTYVNSLKASAFDVIARYLWTGTTGKFVLVLLVAVSVIMIYRHIYKRRAINIEFALFIVSFITCISWYVTAKSSAYIHTYYDMVLWYMGFIQVCIYIIIKIIIGKLFVFYDVDQIKKKLTGFLEKIADGIQTETYNN